VTDQEFRAFAGFGLFLASMTLGFSLFPENHLYGLIFLASPVGLCLILFAGQQSSEEVEEAPKGAWQAKEKRKKRR